MNRVASFRFMLLVVFLTFSQCFAAKLGISITADSNGLFQYTENFETPNFLVDAFVENLGIESWRKGSIINAGPDKGRTLIYRFYGDRVIEDIAVRVAQRAAAPLGATNSLYLSSNGLDWILVSHSQQQKHKPDWRDEPLTVSPQFAAQFTGKSELWVRIVLDNTSGGRTNTSNYVYEIQVKLTIGEKAKLAADPQAAKRLTWGELRRQTQWRTISLDAADPADQRPPRYYQDSDGWLQEPATVPYLDPDETEGFPIWRNYDNEKRLPLALAVFIKSKQTSSPLIARITIHSTRRSCRQMKVLWDGKQIETLDTASFFEADKDFFVRIPGPISEGVHELRIAGGDTHRTLIKRIEVAGAEVLTWAEKPKLPAGGSLQLLSAYYMPDQKPPPNSLAIDKRLFGLYRDYADFGGMRVAFRNNSAVPVRIANTLLLNDKPIEQSYVEFPSPWNTRGVVWYRIRPRSLAPGDCGQLYIRFRRKPAGSHADVTIGLENGRPLKLKIPYTDPPFSIDYITTGKSADTLYVYARRSEKTKPGKVTALRLDGQILEDIKIYGPDFPGNVALVVAKLAKPLQMHTNHIVGIKTESGKVLDARFRVMPFLFLRNSVETPTAKLKQYNMNVALWWDKGLQQCEKYDVVTTRTWRENMFGIHQRVAYYIYWDEPDGSDNRFGSGGKGLGYHARRFVRSGRQELLERYFPWVASWIMTAKTSRPLNWPVYGQLADVFSTDPYPINESAPQADHTFTRECLLQARRACTPHRFYATVEAWHSPEIPTRKDRYKGRFPLPAEYRQSVVTAIGCGMKGLSSWVYRHVDDGWQHNKVLGDEIANVNALIRHIEDYLLIGTPADIVANDAGLAPAGPVGDEKRWLKDKVWTNALLCGPDTIIITAANHIQASKPEPPKIIPAENVTITIDLPDFLKSVTAFEATEKGLIPFDSTTARNKVMLKVDSIESGRVFVLRRR